jgi:solute carrier family 25 oxoglutarate transporter 11
VAKDLFKNEGGLKGLYRGYDSAIMRQCVYTTTRLGIFYSLVDNIKEKQGGKNLSAFQKAYCSLTAGGIGSLVGTPADLILVRMQSDSTLPVDQRRNYKSVFDAGRRIISDEGFLKMFTGCSPTVIRAMVLNLGMLTTYEEAKERLAKAMPNNKTLSWVMASFMSGAVASTMTLPFDNAKTKVQKQVPGADGKLPYKNMFDCMQKTAAKEGVKSLWAGLPTFIFRIAPHVMIVSIT